MRGVCERSHGMQAYVGRDLSEIQPEIKGKENTGGSVESRLYSCWAFKWQLISIHVISYVIL